MDTQCLWCKNVPPDVEPGGHHAVDCAFYRSPFIGPEAKYWDRKLREKMGWSPGESEAREEEMFGFGSTQKILRAISVLSKQVVAVHTQGERIMATLATFISDVTKYQGDVTAALSRAQTDLDTLKAALANAGLTPEQQALLDAADASVNAADTTASGFDVPAATPAP